MKLAIFVALATVLSSVVVALPQTSSFVTRSTSTNSLQEIYQVRTNVDSLYMAQNEGLSGATISTSKLEQTLFTLAKTLDAAATAVQEESSTLDEYNSSNIYYYVQDMQVDIANVTTEMVQYESYIVKAISADTIATILQTLVPGFDKLYRALQTKIQPSYKNALGALFVQIICDMDKAAAAYKPNVQITDSSYCATYYPSGGKVQLSTCPNKAFPSLPTTPKVYNDCKGSCGSVLKYAYQNSAWNTNSGATWCTSTPKQPVWTACTKAWTPTQWVSKA